MKSTKHFSRFFTTGSRLVILAVLLMAAFISSASPAAALGPLDLATYTLSSYGGTQDAACAIDGVTIEGLNNESLHITGNCWKKIDLGTAYDITPNTILEFDFSSSAQGEIQGIGFDVDDTIDNPINIFQLYGTQVYGIQNYNNYSASAPGVVHYSIPVGTFYTGSFQYLTFTSDHDIAVPTADSVFSNIQVYEGTPPPPLMLTVNGSDYLVESYGGTQDTPLSTVTVEDGGLTLHMVGNTWKKVSIPYEVTPVTVLEFDFSSSVEPEISGIGFDVDDIIDNPINIFQLYGTQVYGNQDFNTYSASAPGVVHYTIPVGAYYTGSYLSLTFTNDQDAAPTTEESIFSNIVIYENQATPTITFNPAPPAEYPGADFTVNATTDSDGALTYSYVSGPCALVDANQGTFSPTGQGNCVVQANTAATVYFTAGSAQQSVTISVGTVDLYAISGSTILPGEVDPVPVWGYNSTNSPVSQPGGPTLYYNQGDTVSINLNNELGVDTAILFQGQPMAPDMSGVIPGGVKNYTFVVTRPGTYLYEAGILPGAQYQTAMGLYGALVVRPATAGQAYDDPTITSDTGYDDEAVLVLSEIDPDLNKSTTPETFDLRDFAAKYFLINGKFYPATDGIPTIPGNKVLLRYVNASLMQHSMVTLGVDQEVIAYDGSPLKYSHHMVAETFGPGQTTDVIVTIPTGTDGSKFAVYEGNLMLRNSNVAGYGGMMTFINVGTPPPPGSDVLGPKTSGMVVTPATTDGTVSVDLSASVSDVDTGNNNITAAEYFIDLIGANGGGTGMSGAFASPTEAVNTTLTPALLATLSDGNHALYVHGQDALGNWGSFNFVILKLDRTGPVSKILYMTPNPTNGSVDVALAATGDDRLTGNGNVIQAEYTIDGAGGGAMNINIPPNSPIVSLNVTIPAVDVSALTEGAHAVAVRSQDALGNWGAWTTVDLLVDKTGPVVTLAQATPNPTNGVVGINSTIPAVRLTAVLADGVIDAGSGVRGNIKAVEGFFGTPGTDGTGFVMIPSDGLFNSPDESAYIDIPFSTIAQYADGTYPLYVHGKDAAGNWGDLSSTDLVINRAVPDLADVALANSGAADAMLTASVTNAVGKIDLAEWFIGADPEVGNGVPVQITVNGKVAQLAANINVSSRPNGTYTVYLRAMDAAGNWSNLGSTTLTVNHETVIPPEPGATKKIFIPILSR